MEQAKIAAEREKKDDEKEEDAKKADEEFATAKKALEDKLAAEKKLAGRTFKVAKYTVDALLKKRADFIKDPNAAPATPPQQGGLPPGFDPSMLQQPRVQAVTPPVAVPARPQE